MKKFLVFCLAALVIYTSYHDLKSGTLPSSANRSAQPTSKNEHAFSKAIKIEPGQTVLSVVEHLNPTASTPIQTIVTDFQNLNPGVHVNDIQIGKTYLFPVYGGDVSRQ